MAEHGRTGSEQAFRHLLPVLAVVLAVSATIVDPGDTDETIVALLGLLPIAAWAWWRLPPLLLVALVGATEIYALAGGALESMLFLLSISATVVGGWERSPRVAALAMGLAVAVPTVIELRYRVDLLVPVWVMGIVMPFFLGRAFRAQVELTEQLAVARRELAELAVIDERRRIARDVHDLVGHGLAAVMLHVTGARHVLHRDPAAADEALADAEDIGKRSLQDLRSTLSLLRSTDESGSEPPLPDAADIGAVVQRMADTGLTTTFRSEGDLARVDPAIGLSLHRVAEEALANARRHAPDAATDLLLTVGEAEVSLLVETVGPTADGSPEDAARPRYGLLGMRERMTAVSGTFDAGPTRTGWRVLCTAPLSREELSQP